MTKETKELVEAKTHELGFPLGVFDPSENMEGVVPALPQIVIAHSAQVFKMPDGTKEDSFSGIMLDTNLANAFWYKSYDDTGGGELPDCSSLDGILPEQNSPDIQHENCGECKQNQFGTAAKGEGKACKNMKRVHILFENSLLPYRLTLPPSSLRIIDLYISLLTSKAIPHQLVLTNFSLTEAKNKKGDYSEIVLTAGDPITNKDTVMAIKKQFNDFKPIMRGQRIQPGEQL